MIRYANCGYHCIRNCILKVRIRGGVIVSVEPDEATAEKLDTIEKMVELVSSKTAVGQN